MWRGIDCPNTLIPVKVQNSFIYSTMNVDTHATLNPHCADVDPEKCSWVELYYIKSTFCIQSRTIFFIPWSIFCTELKRRCLSPGFKCRQSSTIWAELLDHYVCGDEIEQMAFSLILCYSSVSAVSNKSPDEARSVCVWEPFFIQTLWIVQTEAGCGHTPVAETSPPRSLRLKCPHLNWKWTDNRQPPQDAAASAAEEAKGGGGFPFVQEVWRETSWHTSGHAICL